MEERWKQFDIGLEVIPKAGTLRVLSTNSPVGKFMYPPQGNYGTGDSTYLEARIVSLLKQCILGFNKYP